MRNRLFRFNEPPGDRATHPVKLDFREGRVRIKCLDLIKLGAGRERRRCGGGNLENRRLRVADVVRSEEHTSELQSLMRISYAVFCLKKKRKHNNNTITT